MVVITFTWDPSFPINYNIMVHTYPCDPSMWLYSLITSVEDHTFINGMEYSVARGIIWGT
jgi:hypothetical protein